MDDDSYTCKECDETCHKCNERECLKCEDENVTPTPGNTVCGEYEHTGDCDPTCETCKSGELFFIPMFFPVLCALFSFLLH